MCYSNTCCGDMSPSWKGMGAIMVICCEVICFYINIFLLELSHGYDIVNLEQYAKKEKMYV